MLFIDRLKSYNFSLDEIKIILELEEDELDEKLSLALLKKKKEIQDRVQAFEDTLKQLDYDILKLNQGISIMSYMENIEVNLVEPSPMSILSIRKMVTYDECNEGYFKFFGRLYEKIAIENLTMVGPPMTIFQSKEYTPTGFDMEFAIPIKESASGTREFTPGLCIKTLLKGSYSNLPSIYAKHYEWAEKENYISSMPPYEIYMNDPGKISSAEELITEVYYPIKKK